jgi:peptide/nickel transport system permease protein
MPELSSSPISLDNDVELIHEDQGPGLIRATLAYGDEPGGVVSAARPRRRKRRIAFWLSCTWIAGLTFVAVFANYLPFVQSYKKITPQFAKPPSSQHWFGTDKIGRDVFARTVYGARVSLAIAGVSIILGLLFGGLFGLLAGYFRKKTDSIISIVMDILLAFPPLILLLSITSFLGRGAKYVILALAILSIPPLTRIVRATTMTFAQREFVVAARSLGAKNGRIIWREVLPNVAPSMLSFALTGLAVLIIAEGALAFLGQSVPPPQPTWGLIIGEGRELIDTAWWISLMPALVLFLTVLSFNIMGDEFAKRFDIRESSI